MQGTEIRQQDVLLLGCTITYLRVKSSTSKVNNHDTNAFVSRVDSALLDLLNVEGFSPEMFRETGFPRIRPILVMLSARAVQRGEQRFEDAEVEHVALATELLHAAIFVHDIALGRQGGRRRRVARRLVGGALGWIGGNQLTLRALELSRQSTSSEVLTEMLDTMRQVAESQTIAQNWSSQLPSVEELVCQKEQREGSMFSFACRAGARIGRADRPHLTSVGRFGFHMGVGLALLEDLHLFSLDKEQLISGLSERAHSFWPPYPLCLVAEEEPELINLWSSLRSNEDVYSAERILDIIGYHQGQERCRDRIVQSSWSARRALRKLPPSEHRDSMESLIESLVV